jgi:hypothetical protein
MHQDNADDEREELVEKLKGEGRRIFHRNTCSREEYFGLLDLDHLTSVVGCAFQVARIRCQDFNFCPKLLSPDF